MTRWQGTTIGSGFAPFAAPTAREAAGRPTLQASSAYEIVSPYGIGERARHVASWNPVPRGASGRSNVRRSPRKYSPSWRARPRKAGVALPRRSAFRAAPGLEVDEAEALLVRRDEQKTDRRIDLVVAHRQSPSSRREDRGDGGWEAAASQRCTAA
jgi:hypothetical protein